MHIEVPTDWALARHLGVPRAAVNAAIALNQQLAAGTVSWAPQLREVLGFAQLAKALGLGAAVANLAGIAPEDDRAAVTAELSKHFAGTISALSVGAQR